jgi:uncharacterized protein YndB with AHSA1/START domain
MTGEATTLRIERVIDAPPDIVFRAWTTPAAMEQWYRDGDGWEAHVTEHDFRVGGRYRIEWGPAGEQPYVEHGVYLEIAPPRRLVMSETITGAAEPGWTDTKVTIVFEEEDGKTRLTLVHEGFASSSAREDASGGWPGFIDRLERLVTTS